MISAFRKVFTLTAAFLAAIALADPVATRLDVTAMPAGSKVFIDGTSHGIAPVIAMNLKPGNHLLRIEAPFCEPIEEFVFIDQEGLPIQKNYALSPIKGIVLLKTVPEGADIRLNGVSVGKTPKLFTNLDCGEKYTFELDLVGYGVKKIDVRPENRKPIVREEVLQLDSGMLSCNSEPEGATVLVNGIERGTTPCDVENIAKGVVSVRMKKEGFKDEVREIRISPGDKQSLTIPLKPLPAKLTVVSSPEGARVFLDDDYQGKTPATSSSVKPGSHKLRVELPGHAPLYRDIELSPGEEKTEEFSMKSTLGRLELTTVPSGVTVIIDGKRQGITRSQGDAEKKSKVLTIEKIAAGEHALILRADGYRDLQRKIVVKADTTTPLYFRMSRVFTFDTEVETIRGTYKGVLIPSEGTEVILETKPGIRQTFQQNEIRKIKKLD